MKFCWEGSGLMVGWSSNWQDAGYFLKAIGMGSGGNPF